MYKFLIPLLLSIVISTVNCPAQVLPEQHLIFDSLLNARQFSAARELLVDPDSTDPEKRLMYAQLLMKMQRHSRASRIADSLLLNGTLDGRPDLKITAWQLIGNGAYRSMNDPEAITAYLKADSIGQVHNIVTKSRINSLANLGSLIIRSEEGRNESFIKTGDEYFKKALDLAASLNDSTLYYDMQTFLAGSAAEAASKDSVIHIFERAIEYFRKEQEVYLATSALWGIAYAYEQYQDPVKAEKYYLDNISYMESYPDYVNGIARAHWVYANFLNRSGRITEAIREFETALDIFNSEENKDIGPITGSMYNLAHLYKQNNEPDKAFDLLELTWAKQDSINQVSEYEAVRDIEERYQSTLKDQQIQALETDKQLKNIQILSALLALGLVLAGIGVFYYRHRSKITLAKKITDLDGMRKVFLENITHEFRTPLALLKGPLDLLESDISLNQDVKSKLTLMRTQGDRMLGLLEQIEMLNRMEQYHIPLNQELRDWTSFIRGVEEPFVLLAREKNLVWESAVSVDNRLFFDADLHTKLFQNLMSNAVKYTPEGGLIRIDASLHQDTLRFSIQNYAPGLNTRDIQKFFERYFRLENDQNGFGIGLSLVRMIIGRLNGTIETLYENDALRFEIQLPVEIHEDVATILSDVETGEDQQVILICDDNQDITALLTEILDKDYRILVASDGESGFQLALNEVPDLIISDIRMPGMTGIELCEKVKNDPIISHIPVVLLTSSIGINDQLSGIGSGADAYLSKPFSKEILLANIRNLIHQRNQLRDRFSKEIILKPVNIAINSAEEIFLEKLNTVIESNLERSEFSADDFASEMNMSRMQLHRKMKQLTGQSAMEYLKVQRLKTAAVLLEKKDISISDAAYAVGFNDLSHFSRSFKSLFGCNPSEFKTKSTSI